MDNSILGELAERSKAAVLKTVEVNSFLGFESLTLRQKMPVNTGFFIVYRMLLMAFFLANLVEDGRKKGNFGRKIAYIW